jgi:hypothetical protein
MHHFLPTHGIISTSCIRRPMRPSSRDNSWSKGQEEPSQESRSHLTDMVLLVDLHDWTRHLRQCRSCLKTNNFKRDSQSGVDYYMKEYQRFLTFKTTTPGVSKDAAARKMVKSVGLRRAVCLKFNPSNHIDQIYASKNLLARRDWPMYMAAYLFFSLQRVMSLIRR